MTGIVVQLCIAEVIFSGKDPTMVLRTRLALAALLLVALAAPVGAGDQPEGLKKGTPDLKSIGPITFGPKNILFIGDSQGAAIFAIDIGGSKGGEGAGPINVKGIDGKVAAMLGTTEKDIAINGLAVNRQSGDAYLSVSRGRGPDGTPVLLRVNREGEVAEVPLKDVNFAKAALPNPAAGKSRQDAITHLAYLDGRVFVSGLSNEEFSSRLRAIPFPFKEADEGANVEIFHGSHGRLETKSPVRTFVPYEIKGDAYILAAYTCTPLVKIKVDELKPGAKVKGTTVAELGNHNRPLDMIVYKKDGKDFILMANSARGLMKIHTDNIDAIEAITQRVADKAGLTYDTIQGVKGVQHLDALDKENALLLVQVDGGGFNLETMALP
jgi:hypothetical protein